MAEKVSAVAGRPYIKGRDLFDIWYLSEVLETHLEPFLLERKLHDYNICLSLRISSRPTGRRPWPGRWRGSCPSATGSSWGRKDTIRSVGLPSGS